jgi:RNA polymerase sigma-70 factor (sigma-E family)
MAARYISCQARGHPATSLLTAAQSAARCVQTVVNATITAMTGSTLAEFAAANTVGLTRFAYVLCGDRGLAEDLVQEAFVALYRRFGEDLPIAAPVAYARRSIVNAHISHRRRRASSALVLVEPPDIAVAAHDSSEQDAMWRALAALPERQRGVLVLRYYLDLGDDDIAATLDCRPGTVRSLAARAFAALRTAPALTTEDSR